MHRYDIRGSSDCLTARALGLKIVPPSEYLTDSGSSAMLSRRESGRQKQRSLHDPHVRFPSRVSAALPPGTTQARISHHCECSARGDVLGRPRHAMRNSRYYLSLPPRTGGASRFKGNWRTKLQADECRPDIFWFARAGAQNDLASEPKANRMVRVGHHIEDGPTSNQTDAGQELLGISFRER